MENIFRSPVEIKQFVIDTLNKASSIDWDRAEEYSTDDVKLMLEEANTDVVAFEKGYKLITDTQDRELALVCDAVMMGLADAYAAQHTYETILSVKEVVEV